MTNFEAGPYGFPVSDQRPRSNARDDSVDQDFEHGTIGAPISQDPNSDIDWQEDYVDQSTCDSCGDDDRVAVTGPGYTPSSHPAFMPEGVAVAADMMSDLPSCEDATPAADTDAAPYLWCRSEQTQRAPRASWTSVLDEAYCKDLPALQWAGDRDYQCTWQEGTFLLKDKQSGAIMGSVSVVQENQFKTRWNATNWDVRTALHITDTTDRGKEAFYAMAVYCTSTGTCNHNFDNSEAPHPVTQTLYRRDYSIAATVGAGAVVTTNGFSEFTFSHPSANPSTSPATASPTVRCDQLAGFRNSAGCVVPGAEPILDMRTRNVTPHAGHIGYAQSSGLPGAPNGTPLTRTTNNTIVQNNRNTTCNRVPGPRPAGRQCDEYPFASTLEGGGAGGPARTYGQNPPDPCPETMPDWVVRRPIPVQFFNSKGVSMCMMPGHDNMRGGGIVSWFYTKNRVHDGDTFYVKGL